ncbi:50S ribosomal protein L10 [Patescibacteria group bacterium]|nr:50S ribosomal protein L10 [Patescibacteria group bacterium]
MAITKQQKVSLVSSYAADLAKAKNVVLVKQSGITVNDSNTLRMALDEVGGVFNVVRKRLFLKSLENSGLEQVTHEALDGAVVAIYAMDDEYAPMKAIQKFVKDGKKAEKKYAVEYVGGWFDKEWKDGAYVSALASLPSKEELVGKLLFLLQHPVQKFVGTLDAIAKK